jgi:hypothetical protein
MYGSRGKIPIKNISSNSVARRDLIPALNGKLIISMRVMKPT